MQEVNLVRSVIDVFVRSAFTIYQDCRLESHTLTKLEVGKSHYRDHSEPMSGIEQSRV
jgi:hypothetical protein